MFGMGTGVTPPAWPPGTSRNFVICSFVDVVIEKTHEPPREPSQITKSPNVKITKFF